MPSRREPQPSGTSSAVSSRPSRTRAIASVRALTAREAVDRGHIREKWESDRGVVVD